MAIPKDFDVEQMIKLKQDGMRKVFDSGGELAPVAFLFHHTAPAPGWGAAFVAMPGLSDQQMREAIHRMALEQDGFFVVVGFEAWVGHAAAGDDAALARLQQAKRDHMIDKLPDVEEVVSMYAESDVHDVRQWAAKIIRTPGQPPTLGPWEERTLRLPRPGFKRYLFERTAAGGKIVKVFA